MKNIFVINSIPFFSSLIFIMINSTIIPIQGYSFINPSVSVVCFIYWCLRKNNFHFNLVQTFLLGVMNDLLLGTPLGSSSLLFIVTRIFLLKLQGRLKFTTFISEKITILCSIIFYYLIVYFFIIIYFKAYLDINYYFMSFLLTLFIYPIVHTIFNWIFPNPKIKVV